MKNIELSDLGFVKDIPAELIKSQKQIAILSKSNKNLRTALWIMGGIGVVLLIAYTIEKNKTTIVLPKKDEE